MRGTIDYCRLGVQLLSLQEARLGRSLSEASLASSGRELHLFIIAIYIVPGICSRLHQPHTLIRPHHALGTEPAKSCQETGEVDGDLKSPTYPPDSQQAPHCFCTSWLPGIPLFLTIVLTREARPSITLAGILTLDSNIRISLDLKIIRTRRYIFNLFTIMLICLSDAHRPFNLSVSGSDGSPWQRLTLLSLAEVL